MEQMLYQSLERCEQCRVGRVYFEMYVRHNTWGDLAAYCRVLLCHHNRLDTSFMEKGAEEMR